MDKAKPTVRVRALTTPVPVLFAHFTARPLTPAASSPYALYLQIVANPRATHV